METQPEAAKSFTFDDEVSYENKLYIVCGWRDRYLEGKRYELQLVPKNIIESGKDYSANSSVWANPDEVTLVKQAATS